MSARPTPTFLGYVLKAVAARPEWLTDQRVHDICSVSGCLSKSPERGWSRWAFNDSGFYDTPELAAQDAEAGVQYELFGYEMFPLVFEDGQMRPTAVGAWLGADQLRLPSHVASGFELLGFDVVSTRSAIARTEDHAQVMAGFDCSPLSCNGRCSEYRINPHCLLDEWEEAVRAAIDFSVHQPEPGPYVIFAVHRRLSNAGSPSGIAKEGPVI